VQRCICHGYIKQSAKWASLKWPQWRPCKCFEFHGCLRAREITDKRYDGPAAALSLLMCKSQYSHVLYSLQAASLVNRHDQQPPVAVRDYISCVCSAAKLGHWCERMRQCTRKQFNSALRSQTTHHKRQCRCRPPTTRDFKGSCRRLSRGPQQVTHGRPIERIASFKCTVCGLMSFLDTQLWEI